MAGANAELLSVPTLGFAQLSDVTQGPCFQNPIFGRHLESRTATWLLVSSAGKQLCHLTLWMRSERKSVDRCADEFVRNSEVLRIKCVWQLLQRRVRLTRSGLHYLCGQYLAEAARETGRPSNGKRFMPFIWGARRLATWFSLEST